MTKTKIFMATSVHKWNDNRIYHKEAKSLSKYFKIELHAPSHFKIKEDNHLTIVGLPLWKKEIDRRRIRNVIWEKLKISPAIIFHFHDPELIWIGIKAKLILGKKVIYDVHENAGASILRKTWLSPLSKIVFYFIYKSFEKISFLLFDHYILAESDYVNFIKSNYTIVRNFPLFNNLETSNDKTTDLIYVGSMTSDRGMDMILDMIKDLLIDYPNISLKLIGNGPSNYIKSLNNIIIKNNMQDNIRIFDYMDYNKAMKHIQSARIGLCILRPVKNYINSYPTKLFDYMSAGIPFICSDFEINKEIVLKIGSGVLVDPDNKKQIIKEIRILLDNPEKTKQIGIKGQKAIFKEYNWENENSKLVGLYKNILEIK